MQGSRRGNSGAVIVRVDIGVGRVPGGGGVLVGVWMGVNLGCGAGGVVRVDVGGLSVWWDVGVCGLGCEVGRCGCDGWLG